MKCRGGQEKTEKRIEMCIYAKLISLARPQIVLWSFGVYVAAVLALCALHLCLCLCAMWIYMHLYMNCGRRTTDQKRSSISACVYMLCSYSMHCARTSQFACVLKLVITQVFFDSLSPCSFWNVNFSCFAARTIQFIQVANSSFFIWSLIISFFFPLLSKHSDHSGYMHNARASHIRIDYAIVFQCQWIDHFCWLLFFY